MCRSEAGTFTAEYTVVAGTRMHAAVLGSPVAPEVVCVHGLACSHRYFRPLAQQLSPGFGVAAVDLPGFGRTPATAAALDVRGLSLALADWIRATGRERSPMVAHSAGCQVVVDLAMHAPELLGPLVLIGPTTDPGSRSLAGQAWGLLATARFERPALWLVLAPDWLRCGPLRALRTFRYLLADPIENKLSRVATPTIVVRGSRDALVSRAWGRQVAALLPDGRYVEVAGGAHAVNDSDPVTLADVIRDLIDG